MEIALFRFVTQAIACMDEFNINANLTILFDCPCSSNFSLCTDVLYSNCHSINYILYN